jgi:hypothetical protein
VGDALIYASFGVEILAFTAIFAVRRPAPPALLLTAVTMLLMFLLDVVMTWLGKGGTHTLWIIHAALPVFTALILWSFSYLQLRIVPRDAMRIAAGLYAVAWLVITAALENLSQFSRFTAPLQALVVLVAAAYTLVARLKRSSTPAASSWFWISLGWLLYFGSGVVLDPVSDMLLAASSMEALRVTFYLKAAINILAYALLTLGVLCGRSYLRFGGSISPPPAPLRSSS